ncbi:hypothetical protein HETIRDRAFT_115898 [Heterobasidion irregulare TC 32-1]|uniref:Uncharacterized protein n=1 Tax=Heterobasidion irregulare (strain TC 32-1) TaxID=747525 RepID=W4K4J6_HETIT|nr:uncharacterized protein HETIRDRAFT_115898 [Heterobasidion irregulare TC 32-1]ETW80674.1 hypothetical protein HETIRDRAFT_115898 [Heterobasidion irregulare TC 32-1]
MPKSTIRIPKQGAVRRMVSHARFPTSVSSSRGLLEIVSSPSTLAAFSAIPVVSSPLTLPPCAFVAAEHLILGDRLPRSLNQRRARAQSWRTGGLISSSSSRAADGSGVQRLRLELVVKALKVRCPSDVPSSRAGWREFMGRVVLGRMSHILWYLGDAFLAELFSSSQAVSIIHTLHETQVTNIIGLALSEAATGVENRSNATNTRIAQSYHPTRLHKRHKKPIHLMHPFHWRRYPYPQERPWRWISLFSADEIGDSAMVLVFRSITYVVWSRVTKWPRSKETGWMP